jgi:hypothetical protein
LTNTGKAGGDAPSHVRSDIYRLSVAAEGEGWSVYLQNALAAVPFGESTLIPVYVTGSRASGSAPRVTLTVVSESDLSQRATVTASIVPAR